jgi:hypothetical protein
VMSDECRVSSVECRVSSDEVAPDAAIKWQSDGVTG